MTLEEYQIIHQQWLEDMFEFEYCDCCGGDTEDHIVVPNALGSPFAMCLADDDYFNFM